MCHTEGIHSHQSNKNNLWLSSDSCERKSLNGLNSDHIMLWKGLQLPLFQIFCGQNTLRFLGPELRKYKEVCASERKEH